MGRRALWCFLGIPAFLVAVHAPAAWAGQGFDFDDMEKIDRAEQGELLEKAKQAARAEQFDQARRLIDQARNKAYDPKSVAAAETVYGNAKAAYEDRKRREEQERLARIEAERHAREQAARDSSGNAGGTLSCSDVSKNYGLYNYCTSGSCSGFAGNYGLYRLCDQNDPGGLSGNYGVYSYLTSGNPYGLKGYEAIDGAQKAAGSFADRKRFIIYYLNGYVYR